MGLKAAILERARRRELGLPSQAEETQNSILAVLGKQPPTARPLTLRAQIERGAGPSSSRLSLPMNGRATTGAARQAVQPASRQAAAPSRKREPMHEFIGELKTPIEAAGVLIPPLPLLSRGVDENAAAKHVRTVGRAVGWSLAPIKIAEEVTRFRSERHAGKPRDQALAGVAGRAGMGMAGAGVGAKLGVGLGAIAAGPAGAAAGGAVGGVVGGVAGAVGADLTGAEEFGGRAAEWALRGVKAKSRDAKQAIERELRQVAREAEGRARYGPGGRPYSR